MAKTRESKLDYIKEYNRTRTKVISFRLNNENDAALIEIYETIPNKMEWFRQCLIEYGRITEKNKKQT